MRFEISEVMKKNQVMDLVFGNCDSPRDILGKHNIKGGQVISAYHPDAVKMRIISDNGDAFEMDAVERQPIFAIYLPGKIAFPYKIEMTFKDGNTHTSYDPYSFPCQITKEEEDKFIRGCWFDSYKKIGCHPMRINGVDGMYFAVWAPSARRVSVVGEFNFWNGMTYPMHRLERSGIFELFLPGIRPGKLYKFEMKTLQGNIYNKADPYAVQGELSPGDASVALNMNEFKWNDAVWMKNRRYKNMENSSMAICDISEWTENREEIFASDFTHILISKNVGKNSEEKEDKSHMGTYLPPSGYQSSEELRALIDYAHQKGVGVLLEISLGYFSRKNSGLEQFDGTALYGFADGRVQIDEKRKMCRFCYERPQVKNYSVSNLLFWMREYHVDGFVFEGVSDVIAPRDNILKKMDVNSQPDKTFLQNKNKAFLENLLVMIKEEDPGVLLIADEQAELECKEEELFSTEAGFDFFWNYSVKNNLDAYLDLDGENRKREHYRITLPLQKAGLEKSVLMINYKRKKELRESLIDNRAPVDYDMLSEAKMSYGFLMGVPGKKICADFFEDDHLRKYLKKLLKVYREYPALYEYDAEDFSFEWINAVDALSSVVSFLRKSHSGRNQLLFICNFGCQERVSYQIGVPKYGRYLLILNSDAKEFGGEGRFDEQNLISVQEPCDFKPYSIKVDVPPRSTLIFEFFPAS